MVPGTGVSSCVARQCSGRGVCEACLPDSSWSARERKLPLTSPSKQGFALLVLSHSRCQLLELLETCLNSSRVSGRRETVTHASASAQAASYLRLVCVDGLPSDPSSFSLPREPVGSDCSPKASCTSLEGGVNFKMLSLSIPTILSVLIVATLGQALCRPGTYWATLWGCRTCIAGNFCPGGNSNLRGPSLDCPPGSFSVGAPPVW
jgi:hypothetical protein